MGTGHWRGRRWLLAFGLAVTLVAGLSEPVQAQPERQPAPAPSTSAAAAPKDGPVRDTEAEALAAAKADGVRVEILALRGERREVYANPDGTLTAQEHAQAVWTVRSGRWVPVDATLVKQADGSVAPKAAVIGLKLSGGGDGPLLEADRAGRRMSLRWPARLPTPTLDGPRATYGEVLPGVDLVVNVGPAGFSHVLVVKNAQAARNPKLAALEFALHTEGLEVKAAGDGLAAVDRATDRAVFESGEPTMWDSGAPAGTGTSGAAGTPFGPAPSGSPLGATASDGGTSRAVQAPPDSARVAKLGVRVGGGKLVLTPDRSMLTDAGTRWPVYIDPVWESTSNSAWAMVDSGYPAEEYWKFAGKRDERIGKCPESCNSSLVKRLFYALPTPYAGKSIISAEFRVTLVHTYNSSARSASLYRAAGGISSATNWSNQPGGSGWSGAALQESKSPTAKQASCTATNQNVGFNATAAVREAANNGSSTTTFGIKADNESDITYVKRFCDNAVLAVNYNRAPDRPNTSELTMSPGGACITGANRPYVDAPPQLYAVLRDPDHSSAHAEQVYGSFRIFWPADAPTVSRFYDTPMKVSGSTFSITAPSDLPQNVTIGWEVRASDGTAWGPWSSGQSRCEFIYDNTQPTAPDIDSPEYLPADAGEQTYACAPDEVWRGSVGVYGTFTFDSAATDVKEYWYGFNQNPSAANKLTPTSLGGPASVRWMPDRDGPNFVTVQAVDQANKKSTIAICHFRVATRPPVGRWALNEGGGPAAADDAGGPVAHPATAGGGVAFGAPGPGGTGDAAARLTGTADSYLRTDSAGLVQTQTSFTVSAWVRLTDDTRDRVAVSQDGSGEPGFTLGYDADARSWIFRLPTTDISSLGAWSVSVGPAVKDEWTHLVAVYNAETRGIKLYVNDGTKSASGQRRTAWKSRGAVQIGRATARSGYTDPWVGDISDVILFDRVVVAREVEDLYTLVPNRRAYWPLNEASEGLSPEYAGGQELALQSGASLYRLDVEQDPFGEPALVGSGHLQLDGVDDYASTSSAVANTDHSFTVSTRVRLASAGCGRDMAVLSQAGTRASGFIVRCGAGDRWQLVMSKSDSDGSVVDTATDNQVYPAPTAAGTHLVVVYNAFTNEMQLYVDGQLADSAQAPHNEVWQAGGAFQVGRALVDGAWGQYFSGVVDDVRVYEGAADRTMVQRLALLTEQPDL
ncbi:LamG-like jellyroll fold domain-containing protein [Planosporangium mesophilum]|nr:LamG-like jellyroll fold domain-containing protein [Planosporangium mesophilum]NJC86760.1 LamG domain-containing protein [Planosporangium mesophilum]